MENKEANGIKSKKELAGLYSIGTRTLKTWIVDLFCIMSNDDYIKQRVFTPKQVKKIVDVLGEP